jgi:hypothetical protein
MPWVLGAIESERSSCKKERPPTPKRVRLFGRHNSSRGATFASMMQTTDLRKRNNLACRKRLYAARPRHCAHWSECGLLAMLEARCLLLFSWRLRANARAQVCSASYVTAAKALRSAHSRGIVSGWLDGRRAAHGRAGDYSRICGQKTLFLALVVWAEIRR